jgi:hypothetical protein
MRRAVRGEWNGPSPEVRMPSRHSFRVALRLSAVAAALSTSARVVAAQHAGDADLPNPRHAFEDSWYWGVKGGVERFGTALDGRVSAPLAGAEWLITHRQGALLVSAQQSFFDRASVVADPYARDGVRPVTIHDARRYAAAALAAPVAFWNGHVRPYAGLGLALQVIRDATPQGDFANAQQYSAVRDRIDDGQSLIAPFLLAGAQAQFRRVAIFVQGDLSGEQTRSLRSFGGQSQVEAGIRYNIASAFER